MTDSLRRIARVVALAALCAVLGGCASSGTVVLLPEKDGRQTAVTVKQGDKEAVLDKPYAAATLTPLGPRAYQATPQDVDAKFKLARDALPVRASSFTLYFVEGKDEFTDESKQVIDGVFAAIA